MESILTSSGLTVCYHGASYKTVSRALRALDPALLLDMEQDPWGRDVWVVKRRVGDDPRAWPAYVVWIEPDGTPRELSMGIVDQMRKQEVRSKADVVDGKRLAESARRVQRRTQEQSLQEYEDVFRDHEHRLKAGHGKPVTISTPLKKGG